MLVFLVLLVGSFPFIESRAMEKSPNYCVVSRFFAPTPSIIQWIVRICDVVDRFLRKPF